MKIHILYFVLLFNSPEGKLIQNDMIIINFVNLVLLTEFTTFHFSNLPWMNASSMEGEEVAEIFFLPRHS